MQREKEAQSLHTKLLCQCPIPEPTGQIVHIAHLYCYFDLSLNFNFHFSNSTWTILVVHLFKQEHVSDGLK